MKKKINIQISFEDTNKSMDSIMESIHKTLMGHAPFVDGDVDLQMVIDRNDPHDEEINLTIDFPSDAPAKNGIISDLALASMVSILNNIKNTVEE